MSGQPTERRRAHRRLPCDACLDSHECWICAGTGARDTRSGMGVCPSCEGSRVCCYCKDDPAPRRRATDRV